MQGILIHNPVLFYTEIIYTAVLMILCFLIYYKTKELYELTNHKGIKYFRTAFLFLGLAYGVRLIPAIIHSSVLSQEFFRPRVIWLIFAIFTAYASTAGILFLAHSLGWKRTKIKHFPIIIHALSILTVLIVMITQSSAILVLLQILVLGYAVVLSYSANQKHKLSQLNITYALIFLFWVFNIFMALNPRTMPLEIKIVSYMISAGIFGLIAFKVNKTTKVKNAKKTR